MTTKSKVELEILEVTGEKKKGRAEKDLAYFKRLTKSISNLSEDDWDDMSEEAQDWYQEAADAINKKKEVSGFDSGDIDEEEEEEYGVDSIEEGDEVVFKSKAGKVLAEGEVVEIDDKAVTVLTDDDEKEIQLRRVGSVEKVDAEGGDDNEEDETIDPEDVEAGDSITITMEDGDEVTGEVEKIAKTSITVDGTRCMKRKIDIITTAESGGDADEDEDEEEEETGEELDKEDVEVGMTVSCIDPDDEDLEGKVTKVSKTSIWIDGDRFAFSKISELKEIESEEEEENETPEGEEIDPEDVEKGNSVTLTMKDGSEVSGEVTRLAERDGEVKAIFVKGKRYGTAKIESIILSGEEEEEEKPTKRGRGAASATGKRGRRSAAESGKKSVGDEVRNIIAQFPKLTIEKVQARLDKKGIEIKESTLKLEYRNAHALIDALVEHGKMTK